MDNKNFYNVVDDFINRNFFSKTLGKTAFIDDNKSISYENLFDKIKNFACSLYNIGLKKNNRVLIILEDTIDFPISFLGSIWGGIIPICINTMLPENDYRYIMEDSEADAVIVSFPIYQNIKNAIKKSKSKAKIIVSGDNISSEISLNDLLKEQEIIEVANTRLDDICLWLYSSGSTGRPKGTLHTHQNIMATANCYAKHVLKVRSDDIFFSAPKLYFAYGLGNALTFPLSVGATSILMAGRPTVNSVMKIIREKKPTLFFGVPTLYASLLKENLNKDDFSSLRLGVSAGEALPAHLYEKLLNNFGVKVLDGIGTTEMLHMFISNRIDKIFPGSTGIPVPGYKARIIKDNGKLANSNEMGELEINGPSSAIGYWNKKEKTKNTFLKNWTRTGDKYIRNNEGAYTYCGRADDMMKVSGQYVSPFEVEAALQKHPSVFEAAVVANKDNNDLIKPKAFIVLNDNFVQSEKLELELTNHVKSILTPFKYPRWYEFTDNLPKTSTGKIQRYKLRKS
ncbi:MAG: Benzoate--CoA ligase [Alphaproteobacteria bacterium MarineAlpha9_Bin1]|nr:MAG: Benzoate--CoA ligase [Alphaproteobacteria bacterium MarineAlpha9_Bin1]